MVKKARSHGLDTSVVVKLITGEPKHLAARATEFLKEAIANGNSIIVSDIVIYEAYFALNTHYDVPKHKAIAALLKMLSDSPINTTDGSPILEVMQTCINGSRKLCFVDRLIHAQYASDGIELVSCEKASGRLSKSRVL